MTNVDLTTYKELYISTALTYIDAFLSHIPQLARVKPDRELMDAVLIPAHSLKSQSYVMGFMTVGRLAAVVEKKLLVVKNGTNEMLTDAEVSSITEAFHLLKTSVEEIDRTSIEPPIADKIAALETSLGVSVSPLAKQS